MHLFTTARSKNWRKHARALAVSSAIVSFVLCVVSTGGCVRKAPSGVFVDPAFGPLVPPDTKYMAGIRLDKIRETPLYKKLNGKFDLNRRLDLFSERTGLDPRTDLWQVLVASNGTDTLVLARGRFTVGEMEPRLGALGSTRTPYKNYTLIGNPQTSVVFINPGVAIAGKQSSLRNLIDHRGQWSQIPPALAAKLAEMPHADQLWMVSDSSFPEVVVQGPDTTGMKSMLSNLLSFITAAQLGIQVDTGAEMKGTVECVSQEGAQRVRDALKGAVGLGRLNTRNDQMDLLKLYDTVQVVQTDSNVNLEARVTPELVDPLLQMLSGVRPVRAR